MKKTTTKESLAQLNYDLQSQGYIADPSILMSIFLSTSLERPILVEGPPGVGKTEIAKVLAKIHDVDLIRLQCYEGLSAEHAIYEWNYQRQLLSLKMMETEDKSMGEKESQIFSKEYILERPLMKALTSKKRSVLLIDEVDRADEAFESFLLELLSDWQISIPELGIVRGEHIPIVVITGNRTRDLSDALRRRCFYLWIDYPDFDKELKIVKQQMPNIDEQLADQICTWMQEVRKLKLQKVPGIAETMDWARALSTLHFDHLDSEIIESTLGIIIKDWADMRTTQMSLSELYEKTGVVSRLS